MSDTRTNIPAPVVATAGWLVPGLGYWLIGQRARAVAVFVTVVALFVMGLWVAGIRVIDVPGFGEDGQRVMVAVGVDMENRMVEFRSNQPGGPRPRYPDKLVWQWALAIHPVAEVLNKPWYIGQVLAGPVTLATSKWSLDLSKAGEDGKAGAVKAHVRVAEIGTLYTAVAGMLNLLVIIDAAHRANRKGGA